MLKYIWKYQDRKKIPSLTIWRRSNYNFSIRITKWHRIILANQSSNRLTPSFENMQSLKHSASVLQERKIKIPAFSQSSTLKHRLQEHRFQLREWIWILHRCNHTYEFLILIFVGMVPLSVQELERDNGRPSLDQSLAQVP